MALLQVNFFSDALKRTVPMQVILPADKIGPKGPVPVPENGYKTLYLLHGLFGNYTDWVCNTRIQQWAEAQDLVVVMPSGDNSFYVDWKMPNSNYGKFIGEELVAVTRKMFPLSKRREDTFIGGLSMGGFGAVRNGLAYGETFGCIAALSAAVHIFEMPLDTPGRTLIGEDWVLGDLKTASTTNNNPRVALAQLKEKGIPAPKVYMACGLQDRLLYANQTLRDHFLAEGVDVTYEETDGNHDWVFWDTQIRKVLEWLPLNDAKAGLSSGNISVEE